MAGPRPVRAAAQAGPPGSPRGRAAGGRRGGPAALTPPQVSLPRMPDIALVSLGTTPGLRQVDATLAEMIRGEGVTCELVPVRIGPLAARLRRQITVTDFVEALAARRAGRGLSADALIFS